MQVNIFEAKNRLSQLIRSVQAGKEIVVVNRGEPVARLLPARAKPEVIAGAGSARAILQWFEGHPLPDYARRFAKEIDAASDELRRSQD